MKKSLLKSLDGFKSIMKGLGTSKDPRESIVYQQGKRIDQNEANNLYVYNWIAAKVVNCPIDDATREWRTLLIPDPDKKQEVEKAMIEFKVKEKVNQAFKWARVFGGSVIAAIIEGEDLETPLNIDSIRPNTLKNFIVLDRYNIHPTHTNMDVMSENFGNPEFYNVSRAGQLIHHSRVKKILGDTPTIREFEQNNYWGNSIYTKGYEPISDAQTAAQSIINLVYESNVDVYGIEGLNALVAEGRDDLVVKRLKIAHEMKSIINGIALDKQDSYEKKTNNFTSLHNIYDRYVQNVSGAYGIPMTKLVGISPAGLSATGESDMRNYYDDVRSTQENDFRPILDWMDEIILTSVFPSSEPFKYDFNPLQQISETEQSDVDLKNAQRDQIYLDNSVVETLDVLSELAENGTYSSINQERVSREESERELNLEE
jgi:phage-related protein (TIGR01555 family)